MKEKIWLQSIKREQECAVPIFLLSERLPTACCTWLQRLIRASGGICSTFDVNVFKGWWWSLNGVGPPPVTLVPPHQGPRDTSHTRLLHGRMNHGWGKRAWYYLMFWCVSTEPISLISLFLWILQEKETLWSDSYHSKELSRLQDFTHGEMPTTEHHNLFFSRIIGS